MKYSRIALCEREVETSIRTRVVIWPTVDRRALGGTSGCCVQGGGGDSSGLLIGCWWDPVSDGVSFALHSRSAACCAQTPPAAAAATVSHVPSHYSHPVILIVNPIHHEGYGSLLKHQCLWGWKFTLSCNYPLQHTSLKFSYLLDEKQNKNRGWVATVTAFNKSYLSEFQLHWPVMWLNISCVIQF